MCVYDTLTEVETVTKGKRKIDSCMADLIKIMNEWGIKTTACCCGHGTDSANVMIDISGLNIRDYLSTHVRTGEKKLVRDVLITLKNPNYDLSLCGSCYCMTHTSTDGMCLKCGKKKEVEKKG